jgi:hypothetical protein
MVDPKAAGTQASTPAKIEEGFLFVYSKLLRIDIGQDFPGGYQAANEPSGCEDVFDVRSKQAHMIVLAIEEDPVLRGLEERVCKGRCQSTRERRLANGSAARLEHPVYFTQCGADIEHVFQNMITDYDIEGPAFVRDALQIDPFHSLMLWIEIASDIELQIETFDISSEPVFRGDVEYRAASRRFHDFEPVKQKLQMALPVDGLTVRAPEALHIRADGIKPQKKRRQVRYSKLIRQPILNRIVAEDTYSRRIHRCTAFVPIRPIAVRSEVW